MRKPPSDGWRLQRPFRSDEPYTVYQTVAELPPQEAFYRESNEIASALRLTIAEFLRTRNLPETNEILAEVFGNDSIGEFPSDRTMCFYIGDLDAFSPELFSALQQDVLSRFPLVATTRSIRRTQDWRISRRGLVGRRTHYRRF